MLNQIRYQQQFQQLQERIEHGVGTVAIYGTRDAVTGHRQIETADGGVQVAQYLSNSEPENVLALWQFSTIGLSGYISQKPY
jgi:hypothetical protein